jgi:putative DNA primase/helicase
MTAAAVPGNDVSHESSNGRALRLAGVRSPLPDCAPRTIADAFLRTVYADVAACHFRGDHYRHARNVYTLIVPEELRARVADFADGMEIEGREDGPAIVHYRTNRNKVTDIVDAISQLTQVYAKEMPAWLDAHRPDPRKIIAFQNGLLNVDEYIASGKIEMLPPTPKWFSVNVLPFELRGDAPEPSGLWNFLTDLWEDDAQSVDLVQEFFGLAMTIDTSFQKILMLIGPQRSGKGTLMRLLTALVGSENIAGPTLSGLASHFGLWPLIGKQLAIISDARLGSKTDQSVIVERLLSISGEDTLTIDRKNREPQSTRLSSRLVIVSNELPKLIDSSGALADRMLLLTLRKSFLGKEDRALEAKLRAELPGVALWALKGLRRLYQRGHFELPQTSVDALAELHELVSPIRAFIADRCIVEAGRTVDAGELYSAWRSWCSEQGREHPGTVPSFGRDLRAAVSIIVRQPRNGETRNRLYEGVGLKW